MKKKRLLLVIILVVLIVLAIMAKVLPLHITLVSIVSFAGGAFLRKYYELGKKEIIKKDSEEPKDN